MADLEKLERIREIRINLESNAIFVHKEIYIMDNQDEVILNIDSSSYLMNADQKPLLLDAIAAYPNLVALFSELIGD